MHRQHSCIQGSPEWLNLRSGIPTSSEFDKIITPQGKVSKSAEPYLFGLLAERMMGHPRIQSVSTWMDRGSQMEAEAVSFYELQRDCETVKIGFVTSEDGTVGASPDRLVGEDGLLEIKVPAEHTHVSYLLKKSVDQAYYPQVQGQLWITERKWVDILSYHPEMPPALIRVERDEGFINVLSEMVLEFSVLLEMHSEELVKRGWIRADWKAAPEAAQPGETASGPEFISNEDEQYAYSLADAPAVKSEPPKAPVGDAANKLPLKTQTNGAAQGEARTDGVPIADGSGPASPPAGPKRRLTKKKTPDEIAGDFGLFMRAAATWKGRLFDMNDQEDVNSRYYGVLGGLGAEHANDLLHTSVQERLKALAGWSAAWQAKTSGSVPPAGSTQSGPAPGDGAFSSEIAPPASNLPPATSLPPMQEPEASLNSPSAEPPVLFDFGRAEFERDLKHLMRGAPKRFIDKLAAWSFISIEDMVAKVRPNEREGRLEAMRTWCR